MNLLIDEKGLVWPATSPRLREALWARIATPDFCSYGVTNLGFAQLSVAKRAIVVRWRPTFMTKETLVGLLQTLMDQDQKRVILSTLRSTWADGICGSREHARDAILREFETARCEIGGHFRAVSRDPDSLRVNSSLGHVLAWVRQTNGQFDSMSLWQMLEHCTGGRFILTEPQGDGGRLTIVAWGKGYLSMNRQWIAHAPGKDFADQPDAIYAKCSSRSYWSAAATGVEVVEDVDASTWWPGHGRSRLHYTRLIVPLTMQGQRGLVLSTAQPRHAP